MIQTSHRLRSALEGALAGGGDPASSPLYVFGPFLQFITVAGAAPVIFGASVWLVVLTVIVVSFMYRQVIHSVTDGTGGSGLTEEEFGAWAVKVNSAITFVEYTLTFLVSIAALVTLLADRYPPLNHAFHGVSLRTFCGVALSVTVGWLVNRGPKTAARAFGPATFGVLLLLWVMIIATVWKLGLHLPNFDLRSFSGQYLNLTLSGYSKLLALMTGIEVFANLVSAYEGKPEQRSRMAFRSLLIAMGTTCATMLIVGPAILKIADPSSGKVSVFTQAMDYLLPHPLPYFGTLIGIVVLASAAAASAQGLQNLALGLRFRHYIPARLGQRNHFDVASVPVWIEVGVVCACFTFLGTKEETYLSLYAVGVFILLSMTGWATVKRSLRLQRGKFSVRNVPALGGSLIAALLTTAATLIILKERFTDGVWAYCLMIPAIYLWFTSVRSRLGAPIPLADQIGKVHVGSYLASRGNDAASGKMFQRILVPLNGSAKAEIVLASAELLSKSFQGRIALLSVTAPGSDKPALEHGAPQSPEQVYLRTIASRLAERGAEANTFLQSGNPSERIAEIAHDISADLIMMSAHGRSELEQLFLSDVVERTIRLTDSPLLLLRPNSRSRANGSSFKRLLVGLDGSHAAEATLRYAKSLAAAFGSEILLLAVPESDLEGTQLEKYMAGVARNLLDDRLLVTTMVTGSGPARTIQAVSEEERCDLLLLARSGRGGANRHATLGSVAGRLLQTCQCAVLLVDAGSQGHFSD